MGDLARGYRRYNVYRLPPGGGGGKELNRRRDSLIAIQMEGADQAVVIVSGQGGVKGVLGEGGLQPQPAQQQDPDYSLETTHRPLWKGRHQRPSL
ncbi:hypothetical protein LCR_13825 [Aeromonas enteropelogenes]|uniref:Uncharacterized protein n=1 Tax=Aeromonas enteropelogenes TaxID=29489 RepID=A0A175VHR8_AEREN|nr:hypothetical protein LCR_13825 [Aeromonas enteropelogenes]